MESLQLKIEIKNKLFYNKFRYRAKVHIKGCSYTYYVNDIDTYIEKMIRVRENSKKWGSQYRDVGIDEESFFASIDVEKIERFLIWKHRATKNDNLMLRMQGDTASFFSNNLDLLKNLTSLDQSVELTEVIPLDSDCLYFKREPKHKYRTYFRGKRMPKDFSENVRSLSDMYSNLSFSKSLFRILFEANQYNAYRYMHGSYYVEYDDEQMLTILAMWFPEMLGKTFNCIKEDKKR